MGSEKHIVIPDIGTDGQVDVIEILVNPGDEISVDDSLITLESDKASMEVPSPDAGVIEKILVKVGDKVKTGDQICVLSVAKNAASEPEPESEPQPESKPKTKPEPDLSPDPASEPVAPQGKFYAGPGVRRLASELGIDLMTIQGSGRKGRITRDDLNQVIKSRMAGGGTPVFSVAAAPQIDFSQFGPITTEPLNKIKRLTGEVTHRSWLSVPHVTQFDEADITELEAFRQTQKKQVEQQGVKLTPLVFIMKAVVSALKAFPTFNASLDPTGQTLILKQYVHIGVAVETPNGLVVPVIREVDKHGITELAKMLGVISEKARTKGLMPSEMQGSCFTISSLGGIGGTAFTPIVNQPDVAILGVSRAAMKPVYEGGEWAPRLMLPLSLSYDHRVIDGAQAARFTQHLAASLSDIRQLLL